jgi:hypothetical protein
LKRGISDLGEEGFSPRGNLASDADAWGPRPRLHADVAKHALQPLFPDETEETKRTESARHCGVTATTNQRRTGEEDVQRWKGKAGVVARQGMHRCCRRWLEDDRGCRGRRRT